MGQPGYSVDRNVDTFCIPHSLKTGPVAGQENYVLGRKLAPMVLQPLTLDT